MPGDYPVQLTVDYPDRPLNRLSSAFRIVTAIPITIVLAALAGGSYFWSRGDTWSDAGSSSPSQTAAIGVGVLSFAPLLMIVFREKYPRWWFDWNVNVLGFINRVASYALLLTDVYPATDEEQAVHLELPYPDVESDLNRWLPLVKWALAIPHFIVLGFLGLGLILCVIASWFAILFTGRLPRRLFDYSVGVMRWSNRVAAYALVLTTDEYPPFRLGA